MSKSPIPAKVLQYCRRYGFTDPFRQDGHWWAFPPLGAMPIQLPIPAWSEEKLVRTGAIYAFALAIVCIAGYVLQRKWLWLQQPLFALQCCVIFYSTYLIVSSPNTKFQKVYSSLLTIPFFAGVTAGAVIGVINPTALAGGLLAGTFAAAITAHLRQRLRAQQS